MSSPIDDHGANYPEYAKLYQECARNSKEAEELAYHINDDLKNCTQKLFECTSSLFPKEDLSKQKCGLDKWKFGIGGFMVGLGASAAYMYLVPKSK